MRILIEGTEGGSVMRNEEILVSIKMLQARDRLCEAGLYVSLNGARFLWIANEVREVAPGIRMSNYACMIHEVGESAIGIFPSRKQQAIDIPGSFDEIVALILSIYESAPEQSDSFPEHVDSIIRDWKANRELNPVG